MVGDNYAMTKLKSFNSQIDLIEILIIGNSHFHPIKPDGFNYKTFNFAVGGSTYYQVYYFLKDNIEKMSSLKSIIINADPLNWSSFNNYRNLNPLLWNEFIDYDELSKFAIFIAVFLGLNPFFLETSQFFRYYQFLGFHGGNPS